MVHGPGLHFSSPSNTVSPNTPYSSGGVNQMPQRPLGSVPLELSQEPVDDSISSRMNWWTDCFIGHQVPFFPCNHVKLIHWWYTDTLIHWYIDTLIHCVNVIDTSIWTHRFGLTQIVYIDGNQQWEVVLPQRIWTHSLEINPCIWPGSLYFLLSIITSPKPNIYWYLILYRVWISCV